MSFAGSTWAYTLAVWAAVFPMCNDPAWGQPSFLPRCRRTWSLVLATKYALQLGAKVTSWWFIPRDSDNRGTPDTSSLGKTYRGTRACFGPAWDTVELHLGASPQRKSHWATMVNWSRGPRKRTLRLASMRDIRGLPKHVTTTSQVRGPQHAITDTRKAQQQGQKLPPLQLGNMGITPHQAAAQHRRTRTPRTIIKIPTQCGQPEKRRSRQYTPRGQRAKHNNYNRGQDNKQDQAPPRD